MSDLHPFFDSADDALMQVYFTADNATSAALTPAWLDGYLTAIAIGPEPIAPEDWLAHLWGGTEPDYGAEAEKRVVQIMLARLDAILEQIRDGTYLPRLRQAPDGGVDAGDSAGDWADGFMAAYHLRTRAWLPLLRHANGGICLLPIMALCRGSDEVTAVQLDNELEIEIHEHAPAMLCECVMDIAGFWAERDAKRERARAPGRSQPGRNDPCPCGSGRKYKKCCGAAA